MPEDPEIKPIAEEEDFEPTPWHFKLLLLAVVLYLAWRAVQGIIWVVEKIT